MEMFLLPFCVECFLSLWSAFYPYGVLFFFNAHRNANIMALFNMSRDLSLIRVAFNIINTLTTGRKLKTIQRITKARICLLKQFSFMCYNMGA